MDVPRGETPEAALPAQALLRPQNIPREVFKTTRSPAVSTSMTTALVPDRGSKGRTSWEGVKVPGGPGLCQGAPSTPGTEMLPPSGVRASLERLFRRTQVRPGMTTAYSSYRRGHDHLGGKGMGGTWLVSEQPH